MGSRFHSLGRAMGYFDCSLGGPTQKRQRPNCSETPRTASTLGDLQKEEPLPLNPKAGVAEKLPGRVG